MPDVAVADAGGPAHGPVARRVAVLIPAAGRSVRFGGGGVAGGRNKLLAPLGGSSVLARALAAFLDREDVPLVVVATSDPGALVGHLPESPQLVLADGGPTRAHSVRNALLRVPADIPFVAVHDAARPLVSRGLIDRAFAAAFEHGAAVPALPVAPTIKEAAGPLPSKVVRTIPRQALYAMQTPQVMRRADLLAAFERCPLPLEQVTDDAQLLELAGLDVHLVEGEERNLKITTPLDLRLAEFLLADAHQG